jgi:peptidoglycan/LPS O-acetylase OafA/YrhL
MRTVLGVIVGYLIFGVSSFLVFRLTGHDPHSHFETPSMTFIVGSIAAGIVAALVGGYVAAAISRKASAATILGIVIAVLAIVGGIASAVLMGGRALWSNIAAVVLMAPAAKLGGTLAKRSA